MSPWMQITAWTLIHFVWQGGLLALATAAGLRLYRRGSSEARYVIACAGLTAMLASPVITAAFLWPHGSVLVAGTTALSTPPGSEPNLSSPPITNDDVSSSANSAAAITRIRLISLLSSVVWAWLAGVTVLLARFAGGCWRVHRLRVASLAEAVSKWQSSGERLAARLRLRVAFQVVESRLVDAPIVIGWMRPVILLPVAVLTNLAPGQIDAILAHELAHIRRRDYAVNLLQSVAETLLFYHPGVWWVSAQVREAREHCCDDIAVEVCGEPAAYAAALMELASWRIRPTSLSVAATAGPLLARVRRLLRVPEDNQPRSITGLVILAVGMLLAARAAVQSSSVGASAAAVVAPKAAVQPAAPPRLASRALAAYPLIPGPSTARVLTSPRVAIPAAQPAADWHIFQTDHFEIYYHPDLDLHAQRVGQEAERAYEQVSADLQHNLPARVDVILFHTTDELEQSVQTGSLGRSGTASRMLLAMDRPTDQWRGLITHEVAHHFGFDIIPGTSTPKWITEGLAEYERGAWDPIDLVALREAIRADTIPKLSGFSGDGASNPRLVYAVGHAAFDFIESRWGKAGVRQFISEGALQVTPGEFDQSFERYIRERFARFVGQSQGEKSDDRATARGRPAQDAAVLAIVNNENLTAHDLARHQSATRRSQQAVTNATDADLPQLLIGAIDDMLVVQRGRELGFSLTDEQFRSAVTNIRMQRKLESDEQFQAALAEQQMTEADLRQDLERQMIMSRLRFTQVFSRVTATQGEDWASYLTMLRSKAMIVWKAADLEQAYRDALARSAGGQR